MVEELKLEKVYAQRVSTSSLRRWAPRILDRLINQRTANVVAISADWSRARRARLGGRLPMMFSELGAAELQGNESDSDGSVLMVLAATPESDRRAVIADHVRGNRRHRLRLRGRRFRADDMLDDIGLDSMMAMEFRVRINMAFSIDLPVLEILRVSVNSLADRVLLELHSIHGTASAAAVEDAPEPLVAVAVDDIDRLMDELSEADLRELLGNWSPNPSRKLEGAPVTSPENPACAVGVRGLAKSYGHLQAVHGLDLDVGHGEIFAILGPNGAGKSTTIGSWKATAGATPGR